MTGHDPLAIGLTGDKLARDDAARLYGPHSEVTPVSTDHVDRLVGMADESRKKVKIWRGYPVDRNGERWCSVCTLWRDVKFFSPDRRRPGGLLRRCRPCQVEAVKRSRDKNGSWPAWQNNQYLKKYGITLDQYDLMAEEQDHKCLLCGNPETTSNKERLCIDHDHETGKVRGLLCSNCNRALGLLRDSPALLRAAAAYIESHR